MNSQIKSKRMFFYKRNDMIRWFNKVSLSELWACQNWNLKFSCYKKDLQKYCVRRYIEWNIRIYSLLLSYYTYIIRYNIIECKKTRFKDIHTYEKKLEWYESKINYNINCIDRYFKDFIIFSQNMNNLHILSSSISCVDRNRVG